MIYVILLCYELKRRIRENVSVAIIRVKLLQHIVNESLNP